MLDEVDRAILRRLELDARLSNSDLAQSVALSPSACHSRVRRLQEIGVIRRYLVEIDEEQLNDGWLAFFGEIVLTPAGRAGRRIVEDAIGRQGEILWAHQVTGQADYLLQVVGRDASIWPNLIERIDPDNRFIAASRVQARVRQVKHFAGLPQVRER